MTDINTKPADKDTDQLKGERNLVRLQFGVFILAGIHSYYYPDPDEPTASTCFAITAAGLILNELVAYGAKVDPQGTIHQVIDYAKCLIFPPKENTSSANNASTVRPTT